MAARKPKRRVRRAQTRYNYTRRTRRSANGGNVWSREEIAFMRKYYRQYPTSWCARQLGRTVYSVRYKASDLSIKKARPSVWRANKGPSQPKWTRRPASRRRVARSTWQRRTHRSRRPARQAKPRRRPTRRAHSRTRKTRH